MLLRSPHKISKHLKIVLLSPYDNSHSLYRLFCNHLPTSGAPTNIDIIIIVFFIVFIYLCRFLIQSLIIGISKRGIIHKKRSWLLSVSVLLIKVLAGRILKRIRQVREPNYLVVPPNNFLVSFNHALVTKNNTRQ